MADGKKGAGSSLPFSRPLPQMRRACQSGRKQTSWEVAGRRMSTAEHTVGSQEGVSVRRDSAEPHFALSLGASVDPACSLLPQVCPGPQRHSLACRSGSSFSVSLRGACLCQPFGPSGDTTGTDPHWLVGRFVASRSFGCSLLRSPVAVPVPSLCPPPQSPLPSPSSSSSICSQS